MSTTTLSLIILSYFIGFIFLLFIRWYDKYDKEPLLRLIFFSILGGLSAVLVASFIYLFVHAKSNFHDAVLKVATVEEFSKILTLFWLYKLIKKDFDEIVDGVIYVAAVSLGFSVIENIFYAVEATFPYSLLFKRFLFATIGHISFSVYMGIAFYVHKKVHKNYSGLIIAYIFSVLAHGFYDGVLFEPDLTWSFLPIYFMLIFLQFRLLKVAYAYSQMKMDYSINNMSLVDTNLPVYCCNCKYKTADKYKFNGIDIFVCQNCGHSIVSQDSFNKLLKYFRPKLSRKSFFKKLNLKDGLISLNKEEDVLYHSEKDKLNAGFNSLNTWFKNNNTTDITAYTQSFEGRIFHLLGFKYLKK